MTMTETVATGIEPLKIILRRNHGMNYLSSERKFVVGGAIRDVDVIGCYHLDPREQIETKSCLQAVVYRKSVLLSGARASGKTTRLLYLRGELQEQDYRVLL
jgi:type IV secretory pathway ATPase VirB11/archaellum biosynthesis ATPase